MLFSVLGAGAFFPANASAAWPATALKGAYKIYKGYKFWVWITNLWNPGESPTVTLPSTWGVPEQAYPQYPKDNGGPKFEYIGSVYELDGIPEDVAYAYEMRRWQENPYTYDSGAVYPGRMTNDFNVEMGNAPYNGSARFAVPGDEYGSANEEMQGDFTIDSNDVDWTKNWGDWIY